MSETPSSGISDLDQRLLVFTRAWQDLVAEIYKMKVELEFLRKQDKFTKPS